MITNSVASTTFRSVSRRGSASTGRQDAAPGQAATSPESVRADPTSSNSFRLDSRGEQIYLYSADTNGALTGYSDGFTFGAAQNELPASAASKKGCAVTAAPAFN